MRRKRRLVVLLPVNNFHGAPSQHKGWSHHDGEAQLLGLAEGAGFICAHAARGLLDVQLGQNLIPLVTVLCVINALGLCSPDLHIALACMS